MIYVEKRPQSSIPKNRLILQGLHVLAVEDDRDSQLLLVHALRFAGARVTAVSTALEALRLVQIVTPDVLVSDIAMPAMDGHGLIRRIRSLPGPLTRSDLPAIALSAFSSPEDRRRTLESGFDEHLAKPVDLEELVHAITRIIEDRRALAEERPSSPPKPET
jgi:CheY-like chemotaxis protein